MAAAEIYYTEGPFPIQMFYDGKDYVERVERKCLICREEFTYGSHEAVKLPCDHHDSKDNRVEHFAGESCLKERFRTKNTCPYCKRDYSRPVIEYLTGVSKKKFTTKSCPKCFENLHVHDANLCVARSEPYCPDCHTHWTRHDKKKCAIAKEHEEQEQHYQACKCCRLSRAEAPQKEIAKYACIGVGPNPPRRPSQSRMPSNFNQSVYQSVASTARVPSVFQSVASTSQLPNESVRSHAPTRGSSSRMPTESVSQSHASRSRVPDESVHRSSTHRTRRDTTSRRDTDATRTRR